jgi:hypothetical protein
MQALRDEAMKHKQDFKNIILEMYAIRLRLRYICNEPPGERVCPPFDSAIRALEEDLNLRGGEPIPQPFQKSEPRAI